VAPGKATKTNDYLLSFFFKQSITKQHFFHHLHANKLISTLKDTIFKQIFLDAKCKKLPKCWIFTQYLAKVAVFYNEDKFR